MEGAVITAGTDGKVAASDFVEVVPVVLAALIAVTVNSTEDPAVKPVTFADVAVAAAVTEVPDVTSRTI